MENADTPDNSILTLLQNQRAGDAMTELSEKLRELTLKVRATGRKGKLTFELTIAPLSKGGGTAVSITDKVKIAPPDTEPEMAIYYVNDDGALSRNDPRQRELPLRDLGGGKPAPSSETVPAAEAV